MKTGNAFICLLLIAACNADKKTVVAGSDIIDSLNYSDKDKKAINAYFNYYDSISSDYHFSDAVKNTKMEMPAIDSGAMANKAIASAGLDAGGGENMQGKIINASRAVAAYKRDHPQEEAELKDIEINVNWIFSSGNSNPPTRVETYFASVSYFGYNFIRGWVDANSCGTNAVFLALCGRKDEAMSWLVAAQAHNPSIGEAFRRHFEYTLNYTTANFGVDVLGHYLGTYWPGVKDLVGYVDKRYANYTPDPNPPAFRPKVVEGEHHRPSRN